MRLAVGAKAHLEMLLFFLFALQADGDLLLPGVLGELLLIFDARLFHLRYALLQFLALRAGPRNAHAGCQKRGETDCQRVNPFDTVILIELLFKMNCECLAP